MVQIYNKNRVIQDRYCQVLKTKKVRNSLSFTPFPMDVYRYLSILTLLQQNWQPLLRHLNTAYHLLFYKAHGQLLKRFQCYK